MIKFKSVEEASLHYAAVGISVIKLTDPPRTKPKDPNTTQGKFPIIKDWCNAATTDPKIIKKWFKQNPRANIGVVMGPKNELVCIDIDPRKEGALAWCKAHRHLFKDAAFEWSGRNDGGMHIIFRWKGKSLPNCDLAPGVDFISKGKQIVVAPSIHPVTLKPYFFKDGFKNLAEDYKSIAELPEELVKMVRAENAGKAPTVTLTKGGTKSDIKKWEDHTITKDEIVTLKKMLEEMTGEGGRHNQIGYWVTNAVACGLPESDIISLSTDWMQEQGRDPQRPEIKNWIRDGKKSLITGNWKVAKGLRMDLVFPLLEDKELKTLTNKGQLCIWKKELANDAHGKLKNMRHNARTLLEHAPSLKGVVGFNELAQSYALRKAPPWKPNMQIGPDGVAWIDDCTIQLSAYIYDVYGVEIDKAKIEEALACLRQNPENNYDPARNYVLSVKWDGVPRLDSWLKTYLSAKDGNKYLSYIGSKWFISVVARIMRPGCQADYMLVLEGKTQGAGKTNALKTIGGAWFSDDLGDITNKDAVLALQGNIIVEISEMTAINKVKASTSKAFLSRCTDRIRRPYEKTPVDLPRRCSLTASGNEHIYLKDETGARRFWGVRCGDINVKQLKADKDQLFAEAYQRFINGEKWYPESHENEIWRTLRAAQEERYSFDEWEDVILSYLNGENTDSFEDSSHKNKVTGNQIWTDALHQQIGKFDRISQKRIANIMTHINWERKALRIEGKVVKGYERVEDL